MFIKCVLGNDQGSAVAAVLEEVLKPQMCVVIGWLNILNAYLTSDHQTVAVYLRLDMSWED